MTAEVCLRGLTWDHRRAIAPLIESTAAFRRICPDVEIRWETQPLSGFESRPLEEVVSAFDLLVFDHPHVGHAAEAGLLRAINGIVSNNDFIGPSLATYHWRGRLWAIPIDAACQTACYRPDLLPEGPPRLWSAMLALGRKRRLGAALNGVHAFLTFLTLCGNLGKACTVTPGAPLVPADVAVQALAAMRELVAACPPEALDWNSIALQEAMLERDDLVYCPIVFGFASYAEADNSLRLAYADIPSLGGFGPIGSIVGGAGLGISAQTAHHEAAQKFATFMASGQTQSTIVACHHGQPAHRDAWHDPAIDKRYGGFFSATRATMDNSTIRPRYAGYMAYQAIAGPLIEGYLRGAHDEATVLARLGIG